MDFNYLYQHVTISDHKRKSTSALYKHLFFLLSVTVSVCVCVCSSVLCQLRCGLPAAFCLLLCDALLSGSAPVRRSPASLCQHPLPGAPPPWHPAVPPQGLPAHELLESWPVEQGETEKRLFRQIFSS